jgi:hypothetical protein
MEKTNNKDLKNTISPITGLPNKPPVNFITSLKEDYNPFISSPGVYDFDPSKYTSPINIDENIEGGSNYFKTLMKPEELVMSNISQVDKLFDNRYQQAVFDRQMQLHDEQGISAIATKALANFGGKTIGNILGGVVGTVYGAGKALFTWDRANFYKDNEIFDALDVWSGFIDDNTVVYGEPGYHERGFFDKIATDPAKLFLQEGADAAAFVAGAVLTEVVTAGIGSTAVAGQIAAKAGQAARWTGKVTGLNSGVAKGVRFAKGLDLSADAARVAQNISKVPRAKKYADNLKALGGTTRALAMGAGYESSLEARENYEQVLHRLVEEYKEVNNGKEPDEAAMSDFHEAARSSSLWTFAGNMAVVGTSNLLQFPKIFWKGYKGQSKLLKTMRDTADPTRKLRKKILNKDGVLVTKASQMGRGKRIAAYGYHGLKNPIREGFEELSQGYINHATAEYYSRKYSSEDTKEALSVLDSMKVGLSKLFGGSDLSSPEWGNAFGMGFLMGLVGLPGMKMKSDGKVGFGAGAIGGSIDAIGQYRAKNKALEEKVTEINDMGGLAPNLRAMFENYVNNNSIQKDIDEEIENGNIFRVKNLEHDQFFSYIRARQKLGIAEGILKDLENLDENISVEEFNKDFYIEEVASFTEEGKAVAIAKAKEYVQKVIDNSTLVDEALDRANIQNPNEEMVDELVHAASVLDNVDKREAELGERVAQISNSNINAESLRKLSEKRQREESKLYPVPIRRKKTKESLKRLEELIRIKQDKGLTKNQKNEVNKLKDNLRLTEFDIDSLIEVGDKIDYTKLRQIVGEQELEITASEKGLGVELKTDQEAFNAEVEAQMKNWEETDPTGYTKHKKEVRESLEDILKLKERREQFIGYYNFLFTEKGIETFNKLQTEAIIKFNIDLAEKQAEEAANAETKTQKQKAASAAGKVSPEAQAEIEKKEKEKRDLKSINAGKIDVDDHAALGANLKARYTQNPELYQQEVLEDLQELLNETDGVNFQFPAIGSFQVLQQQIEKEVKDTTIEFEIIKNFYSDINETIDNYNNSTFEKEEEEDGFTDNEDDNDDGSFDTNLSSLDFVQSREYELEKKTVTIPGIGEISYYILKKDKDGVPIKAKNYAEMTQDDFDYTNSPDNLKSGEKVIAFVDPADSHFEGILKIKVKQGDKIVGLLPAATISNEMEVLRGLIQEEYEKSTDKANFEYSNELFIGFKGAGQLNFSSASNTPFDKLEDPNKIDKKHLVLNEHGEPLLGYGKGYTGTTKVQLVVPGSDVNVPSFTNIKPGAIYMFVNAANGAIKPVRLKPRRLTQWPKGISTEDREATAVENRPESQKVIDLLEDYANTLPQNIKGLAKIEEEILKITPLVVRKTHPLTNSQSDKERFYIKPVKGWSTENVTQQDISTFRLSYTNTGFPGTVDWYININKNELNIKGKNEEFLGTSLRTNLNPTSPIVNANFTLNLPKIAKASNTKTARSTYTPPKKQTQTSGTTSATGKQDTVDYSEFTDEQNVTLDATINGIIATNKGATKEQIEGAILEAIENEEDLSGNFGEAKEYTYTFSGGEKIINVFTNKNDGAVLVTELIKLDDGGTFAVVKDSKNNILIKTDNDTNLDDSTIDSILSETLAAPTKEEPLVVSMLKSGTQFIVNEKDKNTYIEAEQDSTGKLVPKTGGEVIDRVSTIKGEFKGDEKAANRGTVIDDLYRDVIESYREGTPLTKDDFIALYNENPLKKEILENSNEPFSDKFLDELYSTINKIIDKFEKDGYTLYANIPTVTGNLTVNGERKEYAGTIDVLAVDKNGDYIILDFKTSSQDRVTDYFNQDPLYKEGDAIQLAAYSLMIKETIGGIANEIENPGIIPIQTITQYRNSNNVYDEASLSADEIILRDTETVKTKKTEFSLDPNASIIPNNITPPSSTFMPRQAKKGNYTKWDKEQELAWLKKNLPNVDYSVLKDLYNIHQVGGLEAWGLFSNAIIYLQEDAAKGTTFHEAFHAVFNLMLSPREREKILIEAQSRYGLQDDTALEESLADEFMDLLISKLENNEEIAPVKNSWIKQLFNRILRFFNIVNTKKTTIDSLFNDIAAGRYAGSIEGNPLKRNVKKFKNNVKFRVKGLNPLQLEAAKSLIIHDIIEAIELNPNDSVNSIITDLQVKYFNTSNMMDSNSELYYDAGWGEDQLKYASNTFKTIAEETIKIAEIVIPTLPSYGFKVNRVTNKIEDNNIITIDEQLNSSENEELPRPKDNWMESAFEKSPKSTATTKVRQKLTRLPLTIYTPEGDVVADINFLGEQKYVPYDQLFDTLKKNLTNLRTFSSMKIKLEEMSKGMPYIKTLIYWLETDPQFKSGFFSSMATVSADYNLMITSKQTRRQGEDIVTYYSHKLINPNRNNPERVVINEWKSNFESLYGEGLLLKEDSDSFKDLLEYIGNAKNSLNRLKNVDAVQKRKANNNKYTQTDYKNINNLSDSLQKIGFTFDSSDLRIIFRVEEEATDLLQNINNFEFLLDVIFEKLVQKKNVFVESSKTTDPDVTKKLASLEIDVLKKLANYYTDLHLEVYENAFKNVEQKTNFANILPSSMINTVNQLKEKETTKTIDHLRQWYMGDPFYKRNKWLRDLVEKTNKDLLAISYTDGVKKQGRDRGKKYTKMSDIDLISLKLQMYYNRGNKAVANYSMPLLADSPQKAFVSFKKYDEKTVLNSLYDVALQEFERNLFITENKDKLKGINNYAARYVYFPFMNKNVILKKYGLEKDWGKSASKNKAKVIQMIEEELLAKELDTFKNKLINTNMASRRVSDGVFVLTPEYKVSEYYKGTSETFIKEYIYNSVLANTMSSQIFSGDLAFYKPGQEVEDFTKRNKQISVPAARLDTDVTGQTYNTLFVGDEMVFSNTLSDLEAAIEANTFMSKQEKKQLLAQWQDTNPENKIESTDGQAFISLKRYQLILKATGQWTDVHDKAYPRIEKGVGTSQDIALFLQPIKPFVFTKIKIGNKIIPIQNKNSEYAIFPQLVNTPRLINGKMEMVENPRIKKLLDIFNTGIDSIQFKSAVKVGAHNVISFDSIPTDSFDTTREYLYGTETEASKIIELNNEDYGIVLAVPQHFLDTDQLLGSQIRKLAISNLVSDLSYKYDINKGKYTSSEIIELWQDIITSNISEDLAQVEELFSSATDTQIHNILKKEIEKRNLDPQYLEAITLDPLTKKFRYPLFAPFTAKRTEALLNSIFTNNVINQKMPGASVVQVSDFGISKKLRVEYNKQGGVDYLETMMPHYSKELFKPYMDKNGVIDIAKIDKENPKLLESVGFRIPTEEKYSFPPLKIVGFLPLFGGGIIMLPSDFIKMAGIDFDIDKLQLLFNSFEVDKKGKPKYIEYNNSLSADVQSREAKNNMLIETIRSILQDPATLKHLMTPGGFGVLKNDILDEINTLRGTTISNLNIILPSSQIELFNQNIAGTQLVGIMANQSASHAMIQNTRNETEYIIDPETQEEILKYPGLAYKYGIKFAGIKGSLTELFNKKTWNGEEDISTNLAILLAAAVDNAKDPVLGKLNVNTFTADVLTSLLRQGLDLKTAIKYINQPVIVKLAQDYYNGGATPFAGQKAFENIISQLKAIVDPQDFDKYPFSIINLEQKVSESGLAENKGTSLDKGLSSVDMNDLSLENLSEAAKQEKIRLLDSQLRILMSFQLEQRKAEDLTKVVKAFRADSIKAGPTMAANTLFLDNYNNVQYKKMSSFNEGAVENALNAYYVQKGFADVILAANNNISKYMPWAEPVFLNIKDAVSDLKGENKDLTEEEIEFINYNLLSYYSHSFDFFKLDKERYTYYVKNFPRAYQRIVDNDSFLSEELLLTKYISVDTKIDESEQIYDNRLIFNTDAKLSPVQRGQITSDFLYLLESNNPTYRQLGEDLIKYAFATSGLRFTPFSLNSIIPIESLDLIKNKKGETFNNFLQSTFYDLIDTDAGTANIETVTNEFIEDFIKNFYYKFNYLTDITNINKDSSIQSKTNMPPGANFTDSNFPTIYTSFKFKIDETSPVITTKEGRKVAKRYITTTGNGRTFLYKLSGVKEINKETFAFYNIQNTYGIPNRAQELGRGYEGTAFEKENGFTLITSSVLSKDGKKLNITTLNITNDNISNINDRIEKQNIKDVNLETFFFDIDNLEDVKEINTEKEDKLNKGDLKPAFTNNITLGDIKANNVLVFGANKRGFHGQGTAGLAYRGFAGNFKEKESKESFAAAFRNKKQGLFSVLGTVGLQQGSEGLGFGLVSVEAPGKPLATNEEFIDNINELYKTARENPKYTFIVPYNSDSNLNKKSLKELAKDFTEGFIIPDNVAFGDKMLDEIISLKGKEVFEEYSKITPSEQQTSEVDLGTETAPIGGNVVIDAVKGKKPKSGAVVAYRTKGKTEQNMIDALKDDAVGNPFGPYAAIKEDTVVSVTRFLDWLEGKGDTNIMQDYRNALLAKVPELINKKIYYYKDLGRPSHATALDYFLKKEKLNNLIQLSGKSVSGEFELTSELKNIGTKEQYFQYLATVFPNSKVKNIVYHWSRVAFELYDKDKTKAQSKDLGHYLNLSTDPNAWKDYAKKTAKAEPIKQTYIINLENPYLAKDFFKEARNEEGSPEERFESQEEFWDWLEKNYDGIFEDKGFQIAVFNDKTNALRLGSKEDVQGFKDFVNKSTPQTSEVEIQKKDLSFKKGKLETFTFYNGTEVKGTSIIIENQPNVDLFTYRQEGYGWAVIDNKSKQLVSLSGVVNVGASTKNEILDNLHNIIKYSKQRYNRKVLESIGFNFNKPTQQSSEVNSLKDLIDELKVKSSSLSIELDTYGEVQNGEEIKNMYLEYLNRGSKFADLDKVFNELTEFRQKFLVPLYEKLEEETNEFLELYDYNDLGNAINRFPKGELQNPNKEDAKFINTHFMVSPHQKYNLLDIREGQLLFIDSLKQFEEKINDFGVIITHNNARNLIDGGVYYVSNNDYFDKNDSLPTIDLIEIGILVGSAATNLFGEEVTPIVNPPTFNTDLLTKQHVELLKDLGYEYVIDEDENEDNDSELPLCPTKK